MLLYIRSGLQKYEHSWKSQSQRRMETHEFLGARDPSHATRRSWIKNGLLMVVFLLLMVGLISVVTMYCLTPSTPDAQCTEEKKSSIIYHFNESNYNQTSLTYRVAEVQKPGSYLIISEVWWHSISSKDKKEDFKAELQFDPKRDTQNKWNHNISCDNTPRVFLGFKTDLRNKHKIYVRLNVENNIDRNKSKVEIIEL